jgi:hypothetical protein
MHPFVRPTKPNKLEGFLLAVPGPSREAKVNWKGFYLRFKAALTRAITRLQVLRLHWQNFRLRFYQPRVTATITATQMDKMFDPSTIKSFTVEFRTKRLTDLPDLASKIIEEALASVDQQLGSGGRFTSCSKVRELRINDQPALQFSATASGVDFGIFLTGTVAINPDDSIQLRMDFLDTNGWRARESEELAAHTLSCLHSALGRFHGDASGVRWNHMAGKWNHGVLVPHTLNQL